MGLRRSNPYLAKIYDLTKTVENSDIERGFEVGAGSTPDLVFAQKQKLNPHALIVDALILLGIGLVIIWYVSKWLKRRRKK